jgi:hypothetical protein
MIEYIGDENAMLLIEALTQLSEAVGSLRHSEQRAKIRMAIRRAEAVLKALERIKPQPPN